MTASRVATIVVGIVLGTTTGAFAQSQSGYVSREAAGRYAPPPIDPLDNLARTERMSFTVPPVYDPYRPTMSEVDYQSYVQVYQQYLVAYARSTQTDKRARRNEPPTSVKVMQGISAGLSLTDQGLDVVDHALETNALKNALAQYR
jgi:hypothetical protein